MRTALLLALALAAAGCGAFDCPSAGEYRTVDGVSVLSASPEASDTLTVVFEAQDDERFGFTEAIWIRLGAETPSPSSGPQSEISLDVEFSGYDAESPPALRASARRDTLAVEVPAEVFLTEARCAQGPGVVQPVCSYAEPTLRLFVNAVRAPEGVRHVRFAVRGPYGSLRPLSPSASPPGAPHRGTPRRSART